MKKFNILLPVMLMLVVVLPATGQTEIKNITAEQTEEWVSYLASDEMMGRMSGSAQMESAAAWIAVHFRSAGLLAFGDYPDYLQHYSTTLRGNEINERNVIGYIPGSDPDLKDQYIIISAHFDHVGTGRSVNGDSIYNGADDNAAGTATLMGIATYIGQNGIKPGRGIVFAAVSAEEIGMRGSRYLASNLPVAQEDLWINLNFEMTGHSEELGKNRYYTTGQSMTGLDEVVAGFTKGTSFQLVDTIPMAERLFRSSDNISFSRMSEDNGVITGIPSATFATTTMGPHIHSPADEIELFDIDNMTGLINHFSELVIYLSGYRGGIEWTSPGFKRPVK
ncbi:MAG: M20/M25/M40 family metallo-hydrolase [Bacteroidales bacterium]|nr:M20/M25/M40 family metallo-hydrolase [Bacteroidales bacterium]